MTLAELPPLPRQIAHPLHGSVLDWWRGHYEHVFVALHPFVQRAPGDDPMFHSDHKNRQPVAWATVARATGSRPFPDFALAVLAAANSVRSWDREAADARRRHGHPEIDHALADAVEAYVSTAPLDYPIGSVISPALHRQIGSLCETLDIERLTPFEWERNQPDIAAGDLVNGDPLGVHSCHSLFAKEGLLVSCFGMDSIWSLVAMRRDVRARIQPADWFEGFDAGPRTTDNWVNEPGTYDYPDWLRETSDAA